MFYVIDIQVNLPGWSVKLVGLQGLEPWTR